MPLIKVKVEPKKETGSSDDSSPSRPCSGRTDKSSSGSDDSGSSTQREKKAEDPLCHDCGKGIKEGAPRYKKECVHLECGSLRGSATRTLDQDDPSGDMTRHLLKVRRTDPKSYQEILSALGERGSTGRLTVLQKKLLIDATKTHARIRQMRNTEGLQMLDIDEYGHHWKGRKGWKRKYAEKMFKKDCKKDGALVITKENVKRLGIAKPEEYNFDDIVQMKKTAPGGATAESMASLTKGWGNGFGGISVLGPRRS